MANDVLDKQQHYGRYQDQENKRNDWRNTLAKKMTFRSLDIPEEEDDVHITQTKTSGISPWALTAALAAASVPTLGTAYMVSNKLDSLKPPAVVSEMKAEPKAPLVFPTIETRWNVTDGVKVQEYREDGGAWMPVPPGGIVIRPKK